MIWDSSVWTPCGFNCRYILRTLTNIFTQEHLFSPINRLDTLDSHTHLLCTIMSKDVKPRMYGKPKKSRIWSGMYSERTEHARTKLTNQTGMNSEMPFVPKLKTAEEKNPLDTSLTW